MASGLWFAVVALLLLSPASPCAPKSAAVSLAQGWGDVRIEFAWTPSALVGGVPANQTLWLLLRTGSRFAPSSSTNDVSAPDWPFDRALQLVLPGVIPGQRTCSDCRATVWSFEGAWERRTTTALAVAATSSSSSVTALFLDDTVLGLPRNASIEWCARRPDCDSCEDQGSFAFDPSFRWQDGTIALAGSHRHLCAVAIRGAVRCWGWNAHGQLGAGHTRDVGDDEFWREEPAVDLAGEFVEAVAVGWAHSCALTRSGQVWCWGLNEQGQLGLGDTTTRWEPLRPSIGSGVVSIAAGGNHSCAVWSNGSLACWGANTHGQLGLGSLLGRSQPALVPLAAVARVVLGGFHTCALLTDGRVRCWGRNDFGQLGLGHRTSVGDNEAITSVPVSFSGAETVSAGLSHTCVTTASRTAHCWGANSLGQLGLGHANASLLPSSALDLGDTPLSLHASSQHTCAVLERHWLKCWGSDLEGQLGLGRAEVLGDDEPVVSLVPVETGGPVWGVAVGASFTCIVRLAGSVECWGTGASGEVGGGRPRTTRPSALVAPVVEARVSLSIAVAPSFERNEFASVRSISAGTSFTCVVFVRGSVRCWGLNSLGQLGLGHTNTVGADELVSSIAPVSLNGSASDISCGTSFVCAVLVDGAVRCWGQNNVGQLGLGHQFAIGDDELPSSTNPVSLGGPASTVTAGELHVCAILRSGALRCWGHNNFGQLGIGSTSAIGDNEIPSNIPPVPLPMAAKAVSCGSSFTCSVTVDGAVRCWGSNAQGQLGLGHTQTMGDNEAITSYDPVRLDEPVERISSGSSMTCVVLRSGALRCWGLNLGQLGLGNSVNIGDSEEVTSVPPVPLDAPVVEVKCFGGLVCVILAGGVVRCWGQNAQAQLGLTHTATIGDNEPVLSVPPVSLPGPALDLAVGTHHACAVTSGGAFHCWGSNLYGQLGLGFASTRTAMEPFLFGLESGFVDLGARVTMLSAGQTFICALTEEAGGSVRCWGANTAGELGLGSTGPIGDDILPRMVPPVSLNGTAVSVSAGGSHACAVLTGGVLRCWGSNTGGQLGLGIGLGFATSIGDTELPSSVPPVFLAQPVAAVGAGGLHTCAILVGGTLRCWGTNNYGQLGLGHTDTIGLSEGPMAAPAVVLNGSASLLSLGYFHTCVVLSGGVVNCWGMNAFGQLGLGHADSIGDNELPFGAATVRFNDSATSLACGYLFSCASFADGTARCWGSNDNGQLGLGHTLHVGDNELPTDVPVLPLDFNASSVSCGPYHACAVSSTGLVRCWGAASNNQLGVSVTSPVGDNEPITSVPLVPLPSPALSVVGTGSSSCALLVNRTVRCWGANQQGHIGVGRGGHVAGLHPGRSLEQFLEVGIVEQAISVRSGTSTSCALLNETRRLRCWGPGSNGVLGIASNAPLGDNELPMSVLPVDTGAAVVSFGLGASHVCASLVDGLVRCWGANSFGVLGSGIGSMATTPFAYAPVTLPNLVASIVCGEYHTCAVLVDGTLCCWGRNNEGQLGLGHIANIGDNEQPSTASVVAMGAPVSSASCGGSFTCAIIANQTVRCWGANAMGQLGLGHKTTVGTSSSPSSAWAVSLNGSVSAMATGTTFACVRFTDSGVQCWGANTLGQLGLGHRLNIGDDETPLASTRVPLNAPALLVQAGGNHACAVLSLGVLRCWGANNQGQLGLGHLNTIGDNEPVLAVPPVDLPSPVLSVACGSLHSCAVLSSGRIRCWGVNTSGQLGVGHPFDLRTSTLVGATAFSRDLSDLLGRSSALNSSDRFTDPTPPRIPDGVANVRNRLAAADLLVRDPNVTLLVEPRPVPAQSILSFSAAHSELRAVPERFDVWLASSTSIVRVPESLTDPSLCATKRFSAAGPCLVAEAAWMRQSPDWAVVNVSAVDEENLLRPRGATPVEVELSTPWLSVDRVPAVAIAEARCSNVSFLSPTRLRCLSSPGRGTNKTLTLHVASRLLRNPELRYPAALSFRAPLITSVLPSDSVNPFGNQSLRIDGTDFGVRDTLATVTLAGNPCDVGLWTDSVLLCRTRVSSTADSALVLRADDQETAFPITFLKPQVLTVSPSFLIAANDSTTLSFVLSGSAFGREPNRTIHATVGGAPCREVFYRSPTRLECADVPVPLQWSSTDVEVSFGQITATASSVLRLLPPLRLDSVAAPAFPTIGGVSIVVQGRGLGRTLDDVEFVAIGEHVLSREHIVSGSEFELTVPLPPGVGRRVPVRVGLVHNVRSNDAFFSYDRPVVTSVEPTLVLRGSENVSFTLCGVNFGWRDEHFGSALVAGFPCALVSALNGSCARCHRASGPFVWPSGRDVTIEIGGQVSLPAIGLFDVILMPHITAITFQQLATVGGDSLRIIGEGFGSGPEDIVSVVIGTRPSPSITWISSFELRTVAPAGLGDAVPVVVTTNTGLRSTPFLVRYDAPVVRDVSPGYAMVGVAPFSCVVNGSNFGLSAEDFDEVVLGGVRCARVTPVDASSFLCDSLTPPTEAWPAENLVRVCVARRCSETTTVLRTYDRPVVSSVRPPQASAGSEITISGSNFGESPSDVRDVRIANVPCASFSRESREQVVCRIAPGHPLFLRSARPENASDPSAWLDVEIMTAFGARSVMVDASDGSSSSSSSSPRVQPLAWVDGSPPTVTVSLVSGLRLVGKFSTIHASWTASSELGLSGFVMEGRSSDGSVFRSTVSLLEAQRLGRGRNADGATLGGELTVSSTLPVTVRVAAQNEYGPGNFSDPSAPVLENCIASRFLTTHRPAIQWECAPCPVEAVCGGLRSANVTARTGFWRVPWSADRLGFAACKRAEACVGWDGDLVSPEGVNASETVAIPGLVLDPEDVEGCAEGHEGVLCASCAEGYYDNSNGACLPCGSATWIGLRVAGLLILVMVLLGALLYRTFKSAGESSSTAVRTLKVLFNHFQTIAIISAIHFRWPPSVQEAFRVTNTASSFGIEGVSLECVMGSAAYDPLSRSLVSMSTPLWMLLYAAVFWGVEVALEWNDWVIAAVRQRRASDAARRVASRRHTILGTAASTADSRKGSTSETDSAWARWVRRMKVSLPVLIFVAHTSVTKAAFQMVTCEAVAPNSDPSNSQLRLSMDLDTRCNDASNLKWMLGLSIPVMVVFSVGVPLVTTIFIQRNRELLQSTEVKRLFGFLFLGFRAGFEGWEGVNMLRKVLLAGVTVVLGPLGAFNQVGAAQLVVFTFSALHAWFRPYSDASFNRLEMASLFASGVTMVAGQLIEGSDSVAVVQYLGPSGIFIANLVFLLLVVLQFRRVLHRPEDSAGQSSGPRRVEEAELKRRKVLAAMHELYRASEAAGTKTGSKVATTNPALAAAAVVRPGGRLSLAPERMAYDRTRVALHGAELR